MSWLVVSFGLESCINGELGQTFTIQDSCHVVIGKLSTRDLKMSGKVK